MITAGVIYLKLWNHAASSGQGWRRLFSISPFSLCCNQEALQGSFHQALGWEAAGPASSRCQADFFAESTVVDGMTPIQFFDKSDGDIIAWEWDFDDDGMIDGAGRNPIYGYTANGEYSVRLTIKTADCEDTVIKRNYMTVTGCLG